MYQINSIVIALLLFILIFLANEVGHFVGRRFVKRANDDIKSQTNGIQAGILGLLALLLGFTFSMAIQRFDDRTQSVINESNAIGTVLLRTKLLPRDYPAKTRELIQSYIDLRLEASKLDVTAPEEQKRVIRQTGEKQEELWAKAVEAVDIDPRPVTTGMFVSALNDMIDAQGKRNALTKMHVPEVIFYLLFIVFIAAGALMGYARGLSTRTSRLPIVIFTFLIVMVVFIIIDLDRPKRSLIQVNQESMMSLKNE